MEMGSNTSEKSPSASERAPDLIIVRALISCPRCDYNKTFKNQFYRRDLELMVVALKVFDWLTCTKCGELLDLNLEYEI